MMKKMVDSPAGNVPEKMSRTELVLVAVYFAAGILYFIHIPVPHVIALPLLLLSVASWRLLPWQMSLAMMFSFLGDLLGSMHSFAGQMALFAAAHVCLVLYFTRRYTSDSRKSITPNVRVTSDFNVSLPASAAHGCDAKPMDACCTGFSLYDIIATVIVLGIAAFSFLTVVPAVPHGFLKYGVSIYCIVISMMLLTALHQRNLLISAGAVLFVISDMILGWNRFVSRIGGADYLIMVPYYLGQLLLFIGTARFKRR